MPNSEYTQGEWVSTVVQAVHGVLPDRDFIPLHEPEFAGNEWQYVKECLDTGWVSSVGKYVDRFEQALAEYTGAPYAVVTVNGTAALHMALLLAGVGRDDEVLVPALSFVATANAVSYLGAVPHFVEHCMEAVTLVEQALRQHLEGIADYSQGQLINRLTGRRIAALVPMHVFGHPADLPGLLQLAQDFGLPLVEDAAESLGSLYRGRHTGTFGLLGALSFNGNKVMTTGGGGAILTADPELAARAKHLTTTAKLPHAWAFLHDELGWNYRMPNLNAALGCAQLERLPDMLQRKRALAARYQAALAGIEGIRLLAEPEGCHSNYWLNAMLLTTPQRALRDTLLQALNAAGLMSRPAWTLLNQLPMYRHCPSAPLPQAQRIEDALINIPSSPALLTAGH